MKLKTLSTLAVTGMFALPGLPVLAAEDWSIQQLQLSDGYNAVTTSPLPDRGAAGRPGRLDTHDRWLDQQLARTDGYAEPAGASSGGVRP